MVKLIDDFKSFLDQDSPVEQHIQEWLRENQDSNQKTRLDTLQESNMLKLHQAIQNANHLEDNQKKQLHDGILIQTGFKKDKNCHTTLHMAAQFASLDTLTQLINQTDFKEVDALDNKRETCLHQLVRDDQADKFKCIMDKVNDDKKPYLLKAPNKEGQTIAHLIMDKVIAKQQMNTQVQSLWQTLLNHIPKDDPEQILNVTDNNGETILHKAVRGNRQDLVDSIKDYSHEALYSVGEDKAHTPLHIAVKNNNSSMVTALLDINIPMQDETNCDNPLHTALKTQNIDTDIIEELIKKTEYCTNADRQGNRTLQLAIKSNCNFSIINKISERLQQANQLDSQMSYFRNSAQDEGLYHALARYNLVNTDLVNQSSSHPGLLNRQRADGKTPLHIAAEQGSNRTFAALINTKKAGSDESAVAITIQDNEGYTAIQRAIEKGNQHLITQNADRLSQLVAQWDNDNAVDTLTLIDQQMPNGDCSSFFQYSLWRDLAQSHRIPVAEADRESRGPNQNEDGDDQNRRAYEANNSVEDDRPFNGDDGPDLEQQDQGGIDVPVAPVSQDQSYPQFFARPVAQSNSNNSNNSNNGYNGPNLEQGGRPQMQTGP